MKYFQIRLEGPLLVTVSVTLEKLFNLPEIICKVRVILHKDVLRAEWVTYVTRISCIVFNIPFVLPFYKVAGCVINSEVMIVWFNWQALEIVVLLPASWAQQFVFWSDYSCQEKQEHTEGWVFVLYFYKVPCNSFFKKGCNFWLFHLKLSSITFLPQSVIYKWGR